MKRSVHAGHSGGVGLASRASLSNPHGSGAPIPETQQTTDTSTRDLRARVGTWDRDLRARVGTCGRGSSMALMATLETFHWSDTRRLPRVDPMNSLLLVLLGLAAGGLTTVAGLGGGLLMTLALAAVVGPKTALAIAAPALLLGNLHRVWLFRAHVERPLTLAAILGAAPGAFLGGLFAVAVPDAVLQWLLLGAAVFAVLQDRGLVHWQPGPRALGPVAFVSGAMTATSGGGGLLLGPALLAGGVRGNAFVASCSAVATAMHLARIAAYGTGGELNQDTLAAAVYLGVAILAGNLAGRTLRGRLNAATSHRLTMGVLIGCVVLAVAGVG